MLITKVALITGASRGLGFAIAKALAEKKWSLIIDARGDDALEKARQELSKLTDVIAISGDVNDQTHRLELADAVGKLGRLDVLINNASTLGVSPQPNLMNYPLDALLSVYRTNVISPLALIQSVQEWFTNDTGIINVTSDAGVEAYAGWGGYGSSKAGLEHLSAILAEEINQKVYWIDPGDMRTQMHQEAFPNEDISDRPLPELSAPAFLRLLEDDLPSGRYQAQKLMVEGEGDQS